MLKIALCPLCVVHILWLSLAMAISVLVATHGSDYGDGVSPSMADTTDVLETTVCSVVKGNSNQSSGHVAAGPWVGERVLFFF